MGLLFFVSGYFAHGALERRSPGRFLRERCLRLGVPALFYMVVLHPFIRCGSDTELAPAWLAERD